MLIVGFNIKSAIYAVFRNLIIISISLSIYATMTQSAELTLDVTTYTYREVDPNDNLFMEDKSAPFLFSVGLRDWGDKTAISNIDSKNFESGFGSKNLGEMYDKEIGRLDNFITDLEEEEELTDRQKSRLDRLTEKRQIARNRVQDYLMSTETIPGTNITRGQFARDYNQGIGQFAQPDYDALDQQSYTQDLGGGEFTDSMGNVDYSDKYEPGGGE